MVGRVYAFVVGLRQEASLAPESPYRDGYLDALGEVEEWLREELEWEE